jgi:hypothetical protein
MDSRQDKPVYTLSAHTESVTGKFVGQVIMTKLHS